MKKNILFIFAAILLQCTFTFAQKGDKTFKGIITYEISYPESNYDAATLAQLPKIVKTTIGETQTKVEMNTGMYSQTTFTNSEAMTVQTLMDVMGQKFLIKQTKEEIEKEIAKNPNPKIEVGNETKEIAGYTCKKATITTIDPEQGDKEITIIAYFTEELRNDKANFEGHFRGLTGMPLSYLLEMGGMKMQFTATTVKQQKISDKDFAIPEGYQEITQEQLREMFGGNGE
ncbi:MAG: hypothetical protein M0R21_10575 [Lentimicrobiaceae bacterium]|nr:hypothetical protein [Lentimicrobiaceae bacterium]